ncbi:MAG TPA: methyltransferase domain-containing protein [Candidatus Sulfopaludibacter sp.]|nr:methyltransferase domain-containing protein [Candidatus Sulfopaludibacter sp.]
MESADLVAILRDVRERVRARHPESAGALDIALPDLTPLVHARDAALGKVAAIGSVNPRPGGLVNSLVQAWKRLVARVLDWHVREQVEFNRKIVDCVDAAIEALNDSKRAMSELGGRLQVAEELKDIRNYWANWREEWERKLAANEIQFLRSVADLHGGFQHRVDVMEGNYRDLLRAQHAEFTAQLDRNGLDIQKRLWADLERIRLEYERLIYSELRTIRQRAQISSAATAAPAPQAVKTNAAEQFDYGRFAERFRGSEEHVKGGQQFYLPHFAGCRNVLDIGCGRGEFLEMLRSAGVAARGIDLGEESVATCRHKGLEAELADLFVYLADLPEASLDGIFCSQVVEHLPPERLPEMVKLCASRLARDGVIAIETPNPECLAIFATHFYLDPTHHRPIPHPLLVFYLEEFGLGNIEVRRLSPALESMPSLASLPDDVRETFFGALDYAVIARKL